MTTTKTMARLIGGTGHYLIPGSKMAVAIRVTDVRIRFGAEDVLIEPVAGYGSRWVTLESVLPLELTDGTREWVS